MKQVELFKWWLPNPPWQRPGEYLSSWHMSKEDAEKRKAIRPELHTRKVIQVDDKPDINGSFAHLGASWKKE